MERLMTTEEVAETLRIDAVTVRRLVARGELAAYRIAGEFRFTEAEVAQFIESQRVVLNPETTVQQGKFTNRARKVFDLANEEARRYNHEAVGPEHLLLAILRVEKSIGTRALNGLQVELTGIRKTVEEIHPASEEPVPDGMIGMNSLAKDTMELSVQEARGLGHHYLGTEHFVLALLRQEESVANQALQRSGVTYEAARQQILQLLAADQATHKSEQG